MNQIRSWLYDGRGHQNLSSTPEQEKKTYENNHNLKDRQQQNGSPKASLTEAPDGFFGSWLLRVVPLAPGDCLECKLVGTGVMMMSGLMVATSAITARRRNPKLAAMNGAVYFVICAGLCIGFETMAICRLLDVGLFNKESKKTATTS